MLLEFLLNNGFKDFIRIYEPRMARRREIELFHNSSYIDFVWEMSRRGFGFLDGGDTPAFKGCFEASSIIVGGTLTAIDYALKGDFICSVNMAGGLHHAYPDRASGFCIFNDVAVGIAYLIEKGFSRIFYLDIDAHHGDGVMYGFYGDGRVLDIDFHENGLYLFPGSGFPYEIGIDDGKGLKINIPLLPGAGDDAFLLAFNEIIPKAASKFRPEIIIVQCGVDGYIGDPLAHLRFSTKTYIEVARTVRRISRDYCDGRLVLIGGGGYNVHNTIRVWSLILAEILGELDRLENYVDKEGTESEINVLVDVMNNLKKLRELTIIGK